MADRPDYLFGPSNRSWAWPAAHGDSARLAASRSRRRTFEATLPASAPGIPPAVEGSRAL